MAKLVCGVGINDFPGWGSSKNRGTYEGKVYQSWRHMLTRCYNKKYLETRPTYTGCSVCERWLTLSNFAKDIKSLPNYDLLVQGVNTFLDKDIRVPGNKIYSPDTCMFVTKAQSSSDVIRNHPGAINSKESIMKRSMKISRVVRVVNLKTKEVKVFRSQTEASRATGVSQQNISRVLSGERSRCGNYYFERIEKIKESH